MRKVALGAALFVAAAIPVFGGESANAEATQKQENNAKTVVVEKGDYLSKIAREEGTTYHRIFYANKGIEHPDLIYPEEELRIPSEDEKLIKRPMPNDAQVPAETKADKQQNQNNYTPASQQSTWEPAPTAPVTASVNAGVWDQLAACESGGNWSINTGNGYYGGLQFSLGSWQGVGGQGYPHQASKAEQIRRAEMLRASGGWGHWPACAAKLGLL
jgi:LysM repeat protein